MRALAAAAALFVRVAPLMAAGAEAPPEAQPSGACAVRTARYVSKGMVRVLSSAREGPRSHRWRLLLDGRLTDGLLSRLRRCCGRASSCSPTRRCETSL